MSVSLEMNDGVAVITLDDGKANAVGFDLLDGLEPVLDEAEGSGSAVVIAGRPGVFCAGFDLKVLQSGDQQLTSRLRHRGASMISRLYGFPRPIIAASTGHALALGALWLLAFDNRIGAAGDYKYGLNETAIGRELPEFGTTIAQQRLAPNHLTAAVIQSRIYDPEGAIQAGFLDMVVPADQVLATALATAKQLEELPADAYAKTKRRLRANTLAELERVIPTPA